MKEVERKFTFNEIYAPVFTTKARYIDIWGGRGAGRSHFGTDYFLFKITQPEYFRGCFLRNVFSDIRDSLFKDFKDRIEESDFDESEFDINESMMTITCKATGNTIISKGIRKSAGNRTGKLKSLAGITHALCEEADENQEDDINKLDDSIRTAKIKDIQIIFLHNAPPKNHWLCKRFYNLIQSDVIGSDGKVIPYYRVIPKHNPDVIVIFSTYLDNVSNLNDKIIKKYESYNIPDSPFYNPDYYYVDVCGLIPEGARGRIYRNWKHITTAFFNSLPYDSYYGLDFGYSDDPVALVEIKSHNNRNFYKEIIYEPGLTNPSLAALMRIKGVTSRAEIFADSAEPKSIQELKDLGFNVKPALKGADSVLFGIKVVQAMENYATEDSTNLWHENEEYKWALDSNKEPTNTPVDKENHIKDAIRYAVTSRKQLKRKMKFKVAQGLSAVAEKKNPLDWVR
jgi:phage terminase large subunit